MKERLLKIISSEGLTPSLLADEIGVQRSGISHILSGRNYPSFDFMQKLLERFPKLNAEWLIMGTGTIYKPPVFDLPDLFTPPAPVEKKTVTATVPNTVMEKPPAPSSGEGHQTKLPEIEPKILPPATVPQKTIEKMVVLYTDKTFATYYPES